MTCPVPEPGFVAGAVVGEDPFAGDAVCSEPGDGAVPEPDRGGGLFVVVDLGVDEPGAVINGGVDVAVADLFEPFVVVGAASMKPPAAAVGNATDLLDVDVDQLAGALALVAVDGLGVRGEVTAIEATAASSIQDALHGGRGEAGLMGDVTGTPTMMPSQLEHLLSLIHI